MNPPDLITISRLKSYRACPRRHLFEYVHGLRATNPPTALLVGTMAHAAIESYWRARAEGVARYEERVDAALAALDTQRLDPFEGARLQVLVIAYATAWNAIECQVLAVEVQFQTALVNPSTGFSSTRWGLGGKIDLVLRLADGRVAIVEHKTTSSDAGAGSEYRDRLVMDGQITLYFRGAESLGLKADLCIYDVLVKPALRPRKATPPEDQKWTKDGRLYAGQRVHDELPEEYAIRVAQAIQSDPSKYLVRIEIARIEDETAEFEFDVWQTAARMREDLRMGIAPRNPDACHRYGSTCEYLAVCQHRASIDDTTLFRHEGAHPELREQPAHSAL